VTLTYRPASTSPGDAGHPGFRNLAPMRLFLATITLALAALAGDVTALHRDPQP
jgi:hypothetical protein